MAHCKRCNEKIPKGKKKSDHNCDMVLVDFAPNDKSRNHVRWVKSSRVRNDTELRRQLDEGEAKVMQKSVPDPVRSVKDMFSNNMRKRDPATGAVLLGKD